MTESFLTVDWPAPQHIHALTTTRHGGHSFPPFNTLNLGDHVGDDSAHVAKNRQTLIRTAELPSAPLWLTQTHQTNVIHAKDWLPGITADAITSELPQHVCAILTADCLPVLITNTAGTHVAAVHAGWRGLQAGIIEKTLSRFQSPATELLVWLGPAIGPDAFEVGAEVRAAFLAADEAAETAFIPTQTGRFLADIYLLARQRLSAQGITAIYGGNYCTVSQKELFFSYRRDGTTGRMATLIWMGNE